jgi:AcrR family transcriptional regulator
MSPQVRIPAPERERRSHAERTAETRARVMAAVVASIAEVGYQRTTAAEIARRAGVTWGAVQHHFGDKDGILRAVLEEAFDDFARLHVNSPAEGEGIEERVALFIDRSAKHFGSALYRSNFEILLNLPSDLELSWQQEMLAAWIHLWSRYFPETDPEQPRSLDLMSYTVSVLSGLAATRMLEGRGADISSGELRYLKDTLVREVCRRSESR